MDKDQLTAYLRSTKRSSSAINRTLWALDVFEIWLKETLGSSIEENITKNDLVAFIQSAEKKQKNLLLGLANVFEFIGREDLKVSALKMRRAILNKEIKPMRLKDFLGVDQSLIASLDAKGVSDAWSLLHISKTPEARHDLADELDVPYQDLLDLVKMADLSRMFAVKAVRTRLYLESGYDTLDKLAAQDPMELHLSLVRFVDESGFDGIATLPKEAQATVKTAREMERWVMFEKDE